MNILEIPIIGKHQSETEKIYTLISKQPLRNFEGFDFGLLNLDKDLSVYFYFLNQENENYLYFWDIIIPHAVGCILIFDWGDPQSIERNLKTIEYLENNFSTPLHICTIPSESDLPESLIKEELERIGERRLYTFDPTKKESAKNILLQVIDI
jgi:hypothetical protein